MISGKQINNVCKTLTVLNGQIRVDKQNKVIDAAHVSILEVFTLDGSPVFGIEGTHGLDMLKLISLKIDDKEIFNASVDDLHYILKCDGCQYKVLLVDTDSMIDVRRPKVEYYSKSNLDVKRFKKALDTATGISDHVTIWIDSDKHLNLGAKNDDGTDFIYQIGEAEYTQYIERSMYPVDYLKSIVKVIKDNATVQLGTDYPITITWTDEYCQYEYLLAPRIEHH